MAWKKPLTPYPCLHTTSLPTGITRPVLALDHFFGTTYLYLTYLGFTFTVTSSNQPSLYQLLNTACFT
uniref:Uncharacterized protein n=1 Tax=Picea glauca TaxID=3330 RepID=A0A101LVL0_PICGL|nr:hypothetical protein ABT39_MTgene1973 [Picea glauca]QHR88022.1 hypothetical protein Q903MT_gene2034 [Picea sitchensis]